MKTINFNFKNIPVLTGHLNAGKVGVIPTDTLYGLVGAATSQKTVERIYKIRKRDLDKPFIILITQIDDLKKFNVNLDNFTRNILDTVWPGPVSVILNCNHARFNYLHRGKNKLAFRIPRGHLLRKLLLKTCPLVAPSANIQGQKPAETIREAKNYFCDNIDFYAGNGYRISGRASKIIQIDNQKIITIRE